MAQYEKGRKSWRADLVLDGKRYRKRGFSEKKYAELWEAQIKIAHEQMSLGLPSKDHLEIFNLFQEYMGYAKRYKTEKTVETDKTHLNMWLNYFKQKNIQFCREIKRDTWKDYIKWRSTVSNRTINIGLTTIRSAFRWGIENNIIKNNPFEKVQLFKQKKLEAPVYLEKDQINALENLMQKDKHFSSFYPIFATLVRTGLRSSELCSLTIQNYKKDKIVLLPNQTKSKKQRTIPLIDRLIQIFDAQKDIAKSINSNYLFCTSTGNQNESRNLMRRFRRILNKAEKEGLISNTKEINIHTLRKTFISQLVMAGEDPAKVMAIVGHKDWSTMKRYLHLAPGYLDSIRDKINY